MTTPPSGTVTFLLTDIESSTALWERDPATMRDALAWHDSVVREAIERHDGYVFTTAGDSFAAAFADPIRGAAADVEIQETMSSREWDNISALRVRMGLDAGIAEERDGDYFGPPVNRAARIMSLAGGGEVLASHTAADLLRHHLEEGIRLEHVGERELRGVSLSESVFAVQFGPQATPEEPASSRRSLWLWVGAGAVVLVVILLVLALSGGGDDAQPVAGGATTAAPPPPSTDTSLGVDPAPPATTTIPSPETTPPAPTGVPPPPTGGPPGLEALSSWSRVPIDDGGGTGRSPSVAVGRDGQRVIAYNNPGAADLRIAVCRDTGCREAARTILDAGGVGEWPAAAVGLDGLAVVSYFDRPNGDLKVAHCDDAQCSTFTVVTVDDEGLVGSFGAVAIGRDGRAVISYFDESNTSLKVAHCVTLDCSDATTTVVDTGEVGSHTSITIGADGLPIIAYHDLANRALKVAHCDTADCSTATIVTVDTGGPAGESTALVIGNGLPLISYRSGPDVVLVRCQDAFCASTDVVVVATAAGGPGTAVAFGAGNVPLVVFHAAGAGARLARCDDLVCSSASIFSVDPRPGARIDPSIAILPSGAPVIAYFDEVEVSAWVAIPEAAGR